MNSLMFKGINFITERADPIKITLPNSKHYTYPPDIFQFTPLFVTSFTNPYEAIRGQV
jgi:hypothetical protein